MVEIDRARLLFLSGVTAEELSILFDCDSEEDFLLTVSSMAGKAYQAFFIGKSTDVIVKGPALAAIREEIVQKRNSPERQKRLILVKVREYAQTLGNPKLIAQSVGLKPAELDVLIQEAGLGDSYKEYVEKCRADGILKVGKELYNKAVKEKDGKTLQFLAEKVIDEMKEVPKTQGNTYINNGQVQYVQLPPPVVRKSYIEATPIEVIESTPPPEVVDVPLNETDDGEDPPF